MVGKKSKFDFAAGTARRPVGNAGAILVLAFLERLKLN
jgi:hypothetical protein